MTDQTKHDVRPQLSKPEALKFVRLFHKAVMNSHGVLTSSEADDLMHHEPDVGIAVLHAAGYHYLTIDGYWAIEHSKAYEHLCSMAEVADDEIALAA